MDLFGLNLYGEGRIVCIRSCDGNLKNTKYNIIAHTHRGRVDRQIERKERVAIAIVPKFEQALPSNA